MRAEAIVRCPRCARALAVQAAGEVIVETRELEAIGRIRAIRCRCGGVWRAEERLPSTQQPVRSTG